MDDLKFSEEEARYATVKAALDLAAETLSRQHGIGRGDAALLLTMVSLDELSALALGPLRRVVNTRLDIRAAVAAKNAKAIDKARRSHDAATDRFYDAGMARLARADGKLN